MITTKYKINDTDKVVVLTGAGISAESGLKTFRDINGLWRDHAVEDVACYSAFCNQPKLVWEFYGMRFKQLEGIVPNPAHYALVELEKQLGDRLTLITQNVDGLHQIAGSRRVIEMHGTLRRSFCDKCGRQYHTSELDLDQSVPICCNCGGNIRPDVVWFGEEPYFLEKIYPSLEECQLLIVTGTSGIVYPAAGFVQYASMCNIPSIIVNLDKPVNYGLVNEFHQGKAGDILPQLIRELLVDL